MGHTSPSQGEKVLRLIYSFIAVLWYYALPRNISLIDYRQYSGEETGQRLTEIHEHPSFLYPTEQLYPLPT